jgi:hypothetical protein
MLYNGSRSSAWRHKFSGSQTNTCAERSDPSNLKPSSPNLYQFVVHPLAIAFPHRKTVVSDNFGYGIFVEKFNIFGVKSAGKYSRSRKEYKAIRLG